MFAVPGWSVSAEVLKPQTETRKPVNHKTPESKVPNGTNQKSRKRKRSNTTVEITDENLGDLWKSVIEKKSLGSKTDKKQFGEEEQIQKRGREKDDTAEEKAFEGFQEGIGELKNSGQEDSVEDLEEVKRKKKKKRGKEKESINEVDGQVQAAPDISPPPKGEVSLGGGKARYEERRAKETKKREQKAALQANGTLPPTRPESNATNSGKTHLQKDSKLSNQSDLPQDAVSSNDVSIERVPNAPKPTKDDPLSKVPDPPSTSTKLTPLQQRMAAKLTSARFRHLNQTLYTSPSEQAMRLFTDSPQAYTSYHAGFRAQVAVWPQNPVEGFIEEIKSRGSVSIPSQKKMWREQKKAKKPKKNAEGAPSANSVPAKSAEPLPRNKHGICTIADLGCGDATLASSLLPSKKTLNLNLLSFDLAKGDTPNANLITVADITNLSAAGIADGSVDVAICCLSLMGTNWVDVVNECARIVRSGGEMWVAEIKSRFARPGQALQKRGDGIGKQKGNPKLGEENDDPAHLSEMEDMTGKSRKDETDVSAFVAVFEKRGFSLKGEPDMSNKMFVRMRFVRASPPKVEKSVEEEGGGTVGYEGGFRAKQKKGKAKFFDEEVEEVDESKVLKPCVYKTR